MSTPIYDPGSHKTDAWEEMAKLSLPGVFCGLIVALAGFLACFHVGRNAAEAGGVTLWHLMALALALGVGSGIGYCTGRWIERHMVFVKTLTLMATVLFVAVIKTAEFAVLWHWGGLEYALKWLALAAHNPLAWLVSNFP